MEFGLAELHQWSRARGGRMAAMTKSGNVVDAVINRILDYLFGVACVIVAFMMLSICYDVLMRSFDRSTLWVQEINEVGLLYMVFLSIGAVARIEGRHVRIDVVFNLFSPTVKAVLDLIYSFIIVGISAIITWYGTFVTADAVVKNLHENTLLELPVWPILIIIPIGGFLMLIQYGKTAWHEILKFRRFSQGIVDESSDAGTRRFIKDSKGKNGASTTTNVGDN
jgi:C4-dicarboxylate transporter, DctQ subunit